MTPRPAPPCEHPTFEPCCPGDPHAIEACADCGTPRQMCAGRCGEAIEPETAFTTAGKPGYYCEACYMTRAARQAIA